MSWSQDVLYIEVSLCMYVVRVSFKSGVQLAGARGGGRSLGMRLGSQLDRIAVCTCKANQEIFSAVLYAM